MNNYGGVGNGALRILIRTLDEGETETSRSGLIVFGGCLGGRCEFSEHNDGKYKIMFSWNSDFLSASTDCFIPTLYTLRIFYFLILFSLIGGARWRSWLR
jgi:hypothetical protein